MNVLTILILAFALSADSFAVSLSCGLAEKKINRKISFQIATSFAIFQGLFPLIGWHIGSFIKEYIEAWDHWIAFTIMAYLGFRMIKESLEEDNEERKSKTYSWKRILLLSIATSIDAFFVGLSYALSSSDNMLFGALIIGIVTFAASYIGITIGRKATRFLGKWVEVIGGVILILIGIRILFEHLY